MIDKVVADRAPLAITHQRGEGAVLVSASAWASIEEMLYLLRSPANARRLLDSIAEPEAGGGEVHELILPWFGSRRDIGSSISTCTRRSPSCSPSSTR